MLLARPPPHRSSARLRHQRRALCQCGSMDGRRGASMSSPPSTITAAQTATINAVGRNAISNRERQAAGRTQSTAIAVRGSSARLLIHLGANRLQRHCRPPRRVIRPWRVLNGSRPIRERCAQRPSAAVRTGILRACASGIQRRVLVVAAAAVVAGMAASTISTAVLQVWQHQVSACTCPHPRLLMGGVWAHALLLENAAAHHYASCQHTVAGSTSDAACHTTGPTFRTIFSSVREDRPPLPLLSSGANAARSS